MRDEDLETTHLTIRILESIFKKKKKHRHTYRRENEIKFFPHKNWRAPILFISKKTIAVLYIDYRVLKKVT